MSFRFNALKRPASTVLTQLSSNLDMVPRTMHFITIPVTWFFNSFDFPTSGHGSCVLRRDSFIERVCVSAAGVSSKITHLMEGLWLWRSGQLINHDVLVLNKRCARSVGVDLQRNDACAGNGGVGLVIVHRLHAVEPYFYAVSVGADAVIVPIAFFQCFRQNCGLDLSKVLVPTAFVVKISVCARSQVGLIS